MTRITNLCLRCGYTWMSGEGKPAPKTCANDKCRSPYWNRERKNQTRADIMEGEEWKRICVENMESEHTVWEHDA